MRYKKNEFSLEEAIELWKKINKKKLKVSSEEIIENWRKIVGDLIANQTQSVCISNQTLQIKVFHSLWKKELLYQAEVLKSKVNEYANEEIVTKVVVL